MGGEGVMRRWSVGKTEVVQLRIFNQNRLLPGVGTEVLCCHSLCLFHALGIHLSQVWLIRPACSYIRRERGWGWGGEGGSGAGPL